MLRSRSFRQVVRVGSLALLCAASSCSSAAAQGSHDAIPAVATYTSAIDANYAPPHGLAALYAAARAGGTRASRTLTPDAALEAVAEQVASHVARDAHGRSPSARALQAWSWAAGVTDPVPAVVLTHASGTPTDEAIAQAVASMAGQGAFNVVGVGHAMARDGVVVVAAVLAERRVTFTLPIARRVSVGTRIRLSGHLADGLRSPEMAITHPNGQSERFPLGDGPDFMAQFPATARGTEQVELLASTAGGDTVIANFPVYVDMDPPAPNDDVAEAHTQDPASTETGLFSLLNEARRAAGRPPLVLMPALTTVARAHSTDMATHHFIAHNSPTTGTNLDRLRRAGLQSPTVLENVGRGYGAREIQDGLMGSPGHRANILNEHVTHVGIGVVPDADNGGGLVVTEDFIEIAGAVDVNAAPAMLLQRINDTRERRGALRLAPRPQLTEVAGNTARAFFEDPHATQQQVVDRANRQISRFGLIFRRVAVLASVVTRPEEAAGLEPLFDPAINGIGIGVAQGTRPDVQANAVFVVFVVGYPR